MRVLRLTLALLWMGVGLYAALGLVLRPVFAAGEQPFKLVGTYVEGCSCSAPCGCEMVGAEMGCLGFGAMSLTSGSFQGVNLNGTKMAFAVSAGDWVRIYVDAPNARQREAAAAFAKAWLKDWGKLESVKHVPIRLTGEDGSYEVVVDGGKIMQLTTRPMLGGDQRTPVRHSNVKSKLTDTFMQGKAVSGSFKDEGREITLKDSNAYFYPLQRTGRI